MCVCVFGVYRPTREFFTHLWVRHLCRWKATNFDLSSEVSLTCPLRQGPTVYNGHLRGPVTLTHVTERLVGELSLPVLRLKSVATGDRTAISRLRGERSTTTPPRYHCLLFVCLFVSGSSSHSRIFHSYGDVTITAEGLQIFTYARHSRPLGSKGTLACHTYCDTGHPFIMVTSEDP